MKTKTLLLSVLLMFAALAQAQTDPMVMQEVQRLKDMGLFNLPDHHKVNGSTVKQWKDFMSGASAAGGAARNGSFAAPSNSIVARVMTNPFAETAFGVLGAIFTIDYISQTQILYGNDDEPAKSFEDLPADVQWRGGHDPILFHFYPELDRMTEEHRTGEAQGYSNNRKTSPRPIKRSAYQVDPCSLPGVHCN